MREADFWFRLEYRLCHEFKGLAARRCQGLWCDGFSPDKYLLDDDLPRITGEAWIGSSSTMGQWQFTLLLPAPFESRKEIDWALLLPPYEVTGWMAFDEHRQYIEIEPAVAVPDSAGKRRAKPLFL